MERLSFQTVESRAASLALGQIPVMMAAIKTFTVIYGT